MTAAEKAQQDRARTQRRLRAAEGKVEFNIAESMKSAIRLVALPRIIVTSFAPAVCVLPSCSWGIADLSVGLRHRLAHELRVRVDTECLL